MVTMITIGIVSALGIIGIDVTALMAGLGLTGFILGFALKDALSNLLAGMLLLIYHPFKLGDKLMVAGFEGHVVAIDLRYTTLDNDGDKILVPNSMLFTNALRVSELKSTNNHKSQHNN